MRPNLYEDTAHLYDLGNDREIIAEDVEFYCAMIPPGAKILEIGCGTGRVAIRLAKQGYRVTGIDLSEPMLEIFREKLMDTANAGLEIRIARMDMRSFELGENFDWILFPFRVFQALTSDDGRRACLAAVRTHMANGARAVLTLFNPRKDVLDSWGRKDILEFERTDSATGRVVRRYQDQMWHDAERQIIATRMRYEVYEDEKLAQSLIDDLELGYLYPEQCLRLFAQAGLAVEQAYGGYDRRALSADEQNEQIYILSMG
ncbi:MAG: class I SAM-dependent methyltransferase [Candidatus Hydrogenedentes bacterium]|nr:class I SAM-dependent methyltransferase [Candidatus Hydrogenedentota bacterium]